MDEGAKNVQWKEILELQVIDRLRSHASEYKADILDQRCGVVRHRRRLRVCCLPPGSRSLCTADIPCPFTNLVETGTGTNTIELGVGWLKSVTS
jgi:hypothetical protein